MFAVPDVVIHVAIVVIFTFVTTVCYAEQHMCPHSRIPEPRPAGDSVLRLTAPEGENFDAAKSKIFI